MKELKTEEIQLKSLWENIDTSTAAGREFLFIMRASVQMEREIKAERATADRVAVEARGKTGGWPCIAPDKL